MQKHFLLFLALLVTSMLQAASITFQVNMSNQTVSPNGVHIAGSFQGWNPGTTPLIDQGNGIWAVTLVIPNNTNHQYKFINGNSWGNDENVVGTCASSGNRNLSVGTQNVTLPVVCFGSCNNCPGAPRNITFRVDMSLQTVSPNGVHVAGSFQGWNPGATALSHVGGGIYEVTVSINAFTDIQYKFINGNSWGSDESVPGACATGGNRTFSVPDNDATIPTVCFGQCTACPTNNVNVTFQVDMSQQIVSPNGVHVAGNFQGWSPGTTQLTHQGNGVYSVTVPIQENTNIQYKFINGNSWGNDESVPGLCATGGNRTFAVGTSNATIPLVCYGSCTTCPAAQQNVNVTFRVDMSQQTVSADGVHLVGSFQGWNPASTPMSHIGNGIYSVTVSILENTAIQYKFVNGNSWGNDETVPGACATAGNRTFNVGSSNATLPIVCFGGCTACPGLNRNITFQVDMSTQVVSPDGVHIAGSFQGWNPAGTPLTDNGNGIWSVTVSIAENTAIQYKFINGNAWGLDETVPGACATGGNRTYTVGSNNATLPLVCFASCTVCPGPPVDVTFRVNMSQQTISPNGVHLAGNFQGWNPSTTPLNHIGNGIYEVTVNVPSNSILEYKFINGNSWGNDETVPLNCAVGGNRNFAVGTSNADLATVCFGACSDCSFPTTLMNNMCGRTDLVVGGQLEQQTKCG